METKQLERVGYCISSGHYGRIHIEIHAYIGRELSEDERYMFGASASDLVHKLHQKSYELDDKSKKAGEEETLKLIHLFDGLSRVYIREIPNGYNSSSVHNPWLIVTTPLGHFKIGWRKSVINIDWSDTDKKITANELFPDENVTKDDHSIHAHGYEKAREYLLKISKS